MPLVDSTLLLLFDPLQKIKLPFPRTVTLILADKNNNQRYCIFQRWTYVHVIRFMLSLNAYVFDSTHNNSIIVMVNTIIFTLKDETL